MDKSQPTAEDVGATINGRPALSTKKVQEWFSKANCAAPEDAAKVIAQMLNHYAFLAPIWKSTPELRARRRNNPSLRQMERIGEALRTLQTDLTDLIDKNLKEFSDRRANELKAWIALRDSVNVFATAFENYRPRGRGREPELWHNIVHKLGPNIIEIFRSSNGRRAGFGKPTSPAVTVMQAALEYLGEEKSPEAIVDAIRPKRTRMKKTGVGK